MDRMRESLFSILGAIDDRSFLDLFSGSGLVGTEAWSRGARPVVLVEKDRGKRSVILSNTEGLAPRPVLRLEPVERFVQRNKTAFDIVYLDPPFDYPYKEDILRRIAGSKSVVDGSIVLIHAPASERLPEVVKAKGPAAGHVRRHDAGHAQGQEVSSEPTPCPILEVYDRRDYGGSRVTFYRATEGEIHPQEFSP